MGKKQLAAKVLLGLVALGSGVVFGDINGAATVYVGKTQADSKVVVTDDGIISGTDDDGMMVGGDTVIGGLSIDGNADRNTVTIGESGKNLKIYVESVSGGTAITNHDVTNNTVTIHNGPISYVMGGWGQKESVNVQNNIVNVHDIFTHGIFGGRTDSGSATGNKVNIDKASFMSDVLVAGGYTESGNASGNEVTIQGGDYHFYTDRSTSQGYPAKLYGGFTETGTASNNKLTVNGGTFGDTATLYGGRGISGTTGNTITITGGDFKNRVRVAGGLSADNASGNSVIVRGANFGDHVQIVGAGTAAVPGIQAGSLTGNTVTISAGKFGDGTAAFGGYSTEGRVSGNTGTITGGTFGKNAVFIGGSSDSGAVSGNKLSVSDANLGENAALRGGYSKSGAASGNTLTIGGGTFGNGVGVSGGYSDSGDVTDNAVTVSGGTYQSDAAGSFSQVIGGFSGSGAVTRNTLTISGGDFKLIGANAGFAGTGGASNNNLAISGGTFTGSVVNGGESLKGNVTGNTLTVDGGTFTGGSVLGGGYAAIDGDASGNIVTVAGGTFENTNILGGYIGRGSSGTESGNVINLCATDGGSIFKSGVKLANAETLNVYGKNYTVDRVENIKNYNFYIPASAAADDTMLTVENTTADTFADTKINGGVQPGSRLVKGDKVTLIEAKDGNAIADSATVPEKASLTEGVSRRYDLGLAKDGNKVVATVDNVASKDQTKSLVETRMATMTLINQGSDMLASTGFRQAAAAVEGSRGFEPFFAVSGGKLKADTGSHVDTKGIGMNLGFAKKIDNGAGSLLIGPVVEYGRGSYDSHIDDGIHGSGDSHYWGVGLMAKQTNDNGFYYEGSIRVGKSKADYHTDDMNEHTTHVSYNTEGTYWAAHLGLGKVQEISDKNSMDYYAKYFYSHQASDNVHLSTGEEYRFDSVNSSRIRLGARYLHDFGTANRFYGGLAYQYEFSSSAKAHYDGDSTPSPDVKGSSGLIELGAILQSSKDSPLSVDVGVNGWVGKMKGVTFGMKLGYSF